MKPTLPDPIFPMTHIPNQYWYEQVRSRGEFCRFIPTGFSYNDHDFAAATGYVLAASAGLARAQNPTEVDRCLTNAIGEVQTAIWHHHADEHGRHSSALDLSMFQAFMAALTRRAAQTTLDSYKAEHPSWRDSWALLHGLTAVLPPGPAERAEKLREGLVTELGDDAAGALPAWCGTPPTPCGQIRWARDGYGGRLALFIETSDPVSGRQAVYLIDFDAASTGTLLQAGEHPSLAAATVAWEAALPHAEGVTEPTPVTDGNQIAFLDYVHDPVHRTGPEQVEAIMTEFWRAQRRIADAIAWLGVDGITGPIRRDLTEPCVTGGDIAAFAIWLDHYGARYSPEDIAWFVDFWTRYATPGSQRCVAPERVEGRRSSGFFWDYTDAALEQVLAMLPLWTRYCAERDNLVVRLTTKAMAALPATIDDLDIPEHKRRHG